jgi:predicted nucleic acid-binding protein
MKVLFDTNVVLDLLLDREPFSDAATHLVSLVDAKRIDGMLCATTVTTIHYLATREGSAKTAREHVGALLEIFNIAAVDEAVLASALDLGFSDYEDAVLHEAAVAAGMSAIVTRNADDFRKALLPVFEPQELLAAVLASE